MTNQMMFSPAMVSNLYTITCTSQVDPKQTLPAVPYTVPCEEVRKLRAKLQLEETLETIRGLGYWLPGIDTSCLAPVPGFVGGEWHDMEQVIDGCVDTIYVATGTLAAYGVPDLPHIIEVNRANDAKFPNGKATLNDIGKFQKPDGWVGPDHARVRDSIRQIKGCNLFELGELAVVMNR